MSDGIRVRFLKDALYGAVSIVIFRALGWPQWPLAAAHVVSVPGAFVEPSGSRVLSLAFIATVAVALTDVVVVLTFTCNLTTCCARGQLAPAFAPTMQMCAAGSAGVQGSLITAMAMATVGAGALLSLIRAVEIEKAAGGGGWLALAAVYVGIRVYQLTWLWSTFMTVPAVFWVISGGVVALLAVSDARASFRSEQARRYTAGRDDTLYAGAAADCVALALPAVGAVPDHLQPALYVVQAACAAVAVWQAHRYYAVGTADPEDGDKKEKGGGDGEKISKYASLRTRHASRGLYL